MRKLFVLVALLVFLAVAAATTTSKKTTLIKQQTTVAKQTVMDTCDKVATTACGSSSGVDKVNCANKAKDTVNTLLQKVQSTTKDTLSSCGCTEQSEHECTNVDTATQTIEECQCKSVQVCNKNCLNNSPTYHAAVAKTTAKVVAKVCNGDDTCASTVKSHCDEATSSLKKVEQKKTEIKVTHKEDVAPKVEVQEKIKKQTCDKEKAKIESTVKTTCDHVAKQVCAGKENLGDVYVDCYNDATKKVQTTLKKVQTSTKEAVKEVSSKKEVTSVIKEKKFDNHVSKVQDLCNGVSSCETEVKKHCDAAIETVKKSTAKIHVVKNEKVSEETKFKIVADEKKNKVEVIKKSCDTVAKYVCGDSSNGKEFQDCHKDVTKKVQEQYKKIEDHTKTVLKSCGAKSTSEGAKCLSDSHKEIAKKIQVITDLCKDEECTKKVKGHCDVAVTKVKNSVVKVHAFKKVEVKVNKEEHKQVVGLKIKKVLVDKEKKHCDEVVATKTKKIAKAVCAEAGEKSADCNTHVKKSVEKFYKKVETDTKAAIKTCACEVKATHHCSTSDSATQDVTECQCSYIKVCSKDCLDQNTKKVEEKTKNLIRKICSGDTVQVGDKCEKKVSSHCDKVVSAVKKTQIKVHVVNKVKNVDYFKEKAVKAEKKVVKQTVQHTCDKVSKYVCNKKEGKEFESCHNNVKKTVEKQFKKIQDHSKKVLTKHSATSTDEGKKVLKTSRKLLKRKLTRLLIFVNTTKNARKKSRAIVTKPLK
jgi:hypothetical protein